MAEQFDESALLEILEERALAGDWNAITSLAGCYGYTFKGSMKSLEVIRPEQVK